jgi:hypothetical protein
MIMSWDQNAGWSHSMKIDNNSIERVGELLTLCSSVYLFSLVLVLMFLYNYIVFVTTYVAVDLNVELTLHFRCNIFDAIKSWFSKTWEKCSPSGIHPHCLFIRHFKRDKNFKETVN